MPLRKWGLSACAILLASAGFAHAGEQVELGLVNTSVGLKPTSTKNKLKLITDPAVTPTLASTGNPSDYIPVEGLLNNYFNPTLFQLDTSPNTGTFSTDGSTAAGIAPYEVLGFEVQTIDGGLINVQDNGLGGDTITPVTSGPLDPTNGPVGGGENGYVYDIHFKIVNNEISSNPPLTSDQDQDFYQLFLTQITNSSDPGYYSAFATNFPGDPGDSSFVTFAPAPGMTGLADVTVVSPDINGASVPEASTACFLGLAGLTLFARHRRAKRESRAMELSQSQTPPAQE
jgi:hypothetical protein